LLKDDDNSIREQLNLYKYELKEKDLDIIQLQKEINELHLENKLLKAKMPIQQQQQQNNYDLYSTSSFDSQQYVCKILSLYKTAK
jgi:hypothetical protein